MSAHLPKVVIHTDGGCQGNPGIGGWGAVLESKGKRKEISGGEPATTNNRMELRAAIEALNALTQPCDIVLHTDSEYLRNGITKWLAGWKKNGWRTSAKQPVKNVDLWRALDTAAARHKIHWQWVKGHAGVDGNEHCDQLAGAAMKRIRQMFTPQQLAEAMERFKQPAAEEAERLL